MTWYIPLLGIVFFLSIAATKQYICMAQTKGMMDRPNHRSSHLLPTPRGGGVVFVGVWILTLLGLVFTQKVSLSLACYYGIPVILLALVGFLDDLYGLSGKLRILVQAGCAIVALFFLGRIPLLHLSYVSLSWPYLNELLAFFLLLWSINLCNFMDGMDGIATAEALFVLIPGVGFLYAVGFAEVIALVGILIAGLLGFLWWNRPCAKVFMGDIGSTMLGLMILLTALYAQVHAEVPLFLWLMLYGVFLFDATATLLRRILRGEKWYEAHRKHAYQRLHQAGWSHTQVLQGLCALNTVLFLLTIGAYYFPHQAAVFSSVEVILLGILYIRIEKIKPMN